MTFSKCEILQKIRFRLLTSGLNFVSGSEEECLVRRHLLEDYSLNASFSRPLKMREKYEKERVSLLGSAEEQDIHLEFII